MPASERVRPPSATPGIPDPETSNVSGTIRYERVERFAAGSPESTAYLDEHGYVVIADALSPEETERAVNLFWSYLEDLGTGIDRKDWRTWDDDRWPTTAHGGILPSYGIGHCAAQWFIRSVPAVKRSFAAVWGTEDLLVSFDGAAIWRPWALNPAWKTDRGGTWLHIDQHPIGRPGKQCVQGLVNLLPCSPKTGGNIVVPGSHKHFHEIPERYPERIAKLPIDIDHFRYPVEDPRLIDSRPLMAHLEPGDLLLWDSRTIHCSSTALEDPDPVPQLMRIAALVCMMPRSKSNSEVLAARKAAVGTLTSTTNWSDIFVDADKFEPIVQANDADRYRWPPVPELSDEQRRMVGWTDEEIRAERARAGGR